MKKTNPADAAIVMTLYVIALLVVVGVVLWFPAILGR